MDKKVLLMILDGWGEGRHDRSNAIYTQGTPNLDKLRAKYPVSFLKACGEDVGLPEGQMGNSEVGHLNIGAGRIVYQDLVKINRACARKRESPALLRTVLPRRSTQLPGPSLRIPRGGRSVQAAQSICTLFHGRP